MALGRPKKIVDALEKEANVNDDIIKIREELAELGISFTENENLIQLAMKLSKEAKRLNSNKVSSIVDSEELKIKNYASLTNLTDKDLILNLYTAGIPAFYIGSFRDKKNKNSAPYYIFNDTDVILSTEQLWEKVRFSGEVQVDFTKTMSKYAIQPRIKQKG